MLSINNDLQQLFSKVSYDFNPLHTQELYGLKSMFGKQVVHGIHQLFYVLEDFSKDYRKKYYISKIDVKFEKALGVNEVFYIAEKKIIGNIASYKLKNSNDELLMSTKFYFEETSFDSNIFNKEYNYTTIPSTPEFYNVKDMKENLYYNVQTLTSLFPVVSKYMHPVNTAVLLASTRIVGMKYPGLNSIYNSLSLSFNNVSNMDTHITYDVSDRFINLNLLSINVKSDFVNGNIKAFIRPSLPKQKTIKELKDILPYNFAKGQRALIIGGSRGIGLQCLKLLVLGGAETLFTFCRSQNEAINTVKEITEIGLKTKYIQYDITTPSENSIKTIEEFNPTHIYYFATPKITSNTSKINETILANYIKYYIIGLSTIINRLKNNVSIFTPSSVFVDELPNGLTEYCIAKYALEKYIEKLNKSGTYAYAPRFPRTETEQTLSLIKQECLKAEEILKKELLVFAEHKKSIYV